MELECNVDTLARYARRLHVTVVDAKKVVRRVPTQLILFSPFIERSLTILFTKNVNG